MPNVRYALWVSLGQIHTRYHDHIIRLEILLFKVFNLGIRIVVDENLQLATGVVL